MLIQWVFGRQAPNRRRSNDYFGKIGEIPINKSTAQSLRVGENPLNGNGLPLTGNAEGEELVYSRSEKRWIL